MPDCDIVNFATCFYLLCEFLSVDVVLVPIASLYCTHRTVTDTHDEVKNKIPQPFVHHIRVTCDNVINLLERRRSIVLHLRNVIDVDPNSQH